MGRQKGKRHYVVYTPNVPNSKGNEAYWACDGYLAYYWPIQKDHSETHLPSEVTCLNCKRNKIYKEELRKEMYATDFPLFTLLKEPW